MLDLDNLPALLCKAHKLKWFNLYTLQTILLNMHKKMMLQLVKVHKLWLL